MLIAAQQGHLDVFRYLDKSGARTPWLFVLQNCLSDIVRHLVEVGAYKFWGISAACCCRRRQSGHDSAYG